MLPNASRTDDYIHLLDTEISLTDTNQLEWTIHENIPAGEYHIGIGFFYHEISSELVVIKNENHEKFILQDDN